MANGGEREAVTHTSDTLDDADPTSIEGWRKEGERRGPGRPPTTGEHVGLAQAKERENRERERALQLDKEERYAKMSAEEVVRVCRIDVETIMEKAESDPTADIANRISGLQHDVLRVTRGSSNLKGTDQKTLKAAAANTLGLVEVLRTRADRSAELVNTAEMRALRRDLDEMRRALEDAKRGMAERLAEQSAAYEAQLGEARAMLQSERETARRHLEMYEEVVRGREARSRGPREKEHG